MKKSEPQHLILRNNLLYWGDSILKCTWGKGGIRQDKVEGDGATPMGRFPFRHVYYRPDRLERPTTHLPLQALTQDDGWCDDPNDVNYNQFVKLPYQARHEKLWRDDHIYDIILVVGYNDTPIVKGKGSAVFVHLMRPNKTPTEGCIAFSQKDLLQVLNTATLESHLIVE